ncbi:hypothetical protein HBI56_215780 [Parastagonospora nodorum]|uniref:Uncharacterized protein n=1 Tax=Phaeosphaeria nodorum (strain SN15 / ATCC MYA-4574 / FGSC 10173) TaxID=321614 RepID=A0A7U2F421_PHANO|nr:hypothetical protein HBH56_176680 [Parastagonospora nodorum]QRC96169.1 hypothetical protein JI435_408360 [Parastagonospora nodorum SN15]KAH3926230.1 hypothetical protein HBH54_166480 [Parastagonospora nodorum]KAH3965705.1 hypothetical protein HBH52_203120 [Parastagonospora nodorum]KAH3971223.1 hypothetical protein HBH51_108850 [Parastagonospora nodorum]
MTTTSPISLSTYCGCAGTHSRRFTHTKCLFLTGNVEMEPTRPCGSFGPTKSAQLLTNMARNRLIWAGSARCLAAAIARLRRACTCLDAGSPHLQS